MGATSGKYQKLCFVCACVVHRCGASFPCLGSQMHVFGHVLFVRAIRGLYFMAGACAPDASSSCPLGWAEDVEPGVCLSPAGYSGPCVQRKSFLGMGARDRELWAKSCEVTWLVDLFLAMLWAVCRCLWWWRPCRQKLLSDLESAGPIARGAFKSDCVTDYSGPCPDRHTLKDGLCEAPADFLGRCGFTLSSQHSTAEKVAYAEVCLTPWPCRVAAA